MAVGIAAGMMLQKSLDEQKRQEEQKHQQEQERIEAQDIHRLEKAIQEDVQREKQENSDKNLFGLSSKSLQEAKAKSALRSLEAAYIRLYGNTSKIDYNNWNV